MNRLLKITAIIEGLTGLALLAAPDFVVRLLLGAEISGAAVPLGRVAGVALLALGAAGLQMQPTGIALWPAVALHAGLALWCIVHHLQGNRNPSSPL